MTTKIMVGKLLLHWNLELVVLCLQHFLAITITYITIMPAALSGCITTITILSAALSSCTCSN